MHHHHSRSSGLWPGLFLVSVGVGLLLREFELLPAEIRWIDFWPLLVVFFGLAKLSRGEGASARLFGLVLAGAGGVLLAGNLGFFPISAARLWPGLLVLVGLSVLFRRPSAGGPPGASRPSGRCAPSRGAEHHFEPTSEDTLERQVTLAGTQIRVESGAWRGGHLGVTAGGVELDLRYATLAAEGAVLDLRIVAGGVEIRVPDTWQVQCDVSPVLGGVDDSTRRTQGTTAPRLRITGSVQLGGVDIRN